MTRTVFLVAGALLTATPLLAQTSGAGAGSSSSTAGNGVTTGTTSSPEMKAGAERSPTAGAPTGSSESASGGAAGGTPSRN